MNDSDAPALPCSEKIGFATKAEAGAAGVVAKYRYGRGALKPYLCKYCGLWHLSSG